MWAVLPRTALQSVVSSSRLAPQDKGVRRGQTLNALLANDDAFLDGLGGDGVDPCGGGKRWFGLAPGRVPAGCRGVESSYVSQMVNLTVLAPDIVAAILDEALAPDLTLFDLAVDPPALWEEQRGRIGGH
ncbi:MAG: hypothetical protein ACREX9_01015 [Gammaproteobacteria bacterium]